MCLDVLRDKNNRILEPLDEVNDLSARESIDQVGIDRQRLLLAEINKLPENQASVVRLRFVDDCDISEIAERLGLRKNTVEVRLHRALAKLAKSPRLQALKEESL
jgi:RNA polymerase sigma factor (sigma-70 family)